MQVAAPVEQAAVRVRDYAPDRRDLSALFRLALPVSVVQVGLMAMGAVDTVMVGRVSAVDLAAVAIGHIYFFGVAVFGMGILYALDPVISQAVGAGDGTGIARGVQRGGVLAAALSAAAMALLLPAPWILELLRQPAEVVPVASQYAQGLIPGVFPFYGFVVLRQSLQAMGRVRAILFAVLASNLVNVFLNWVLIFGNLGFEARGAVGSAWGTSLSRWFMMLALVAFAWPLLRPQLVPFRREALALAPLVRFVRVGAPVGMQQSMEFGVFGAAGVLMGWLGALALAGHQVALQLAALTFMVPLGVAQATSVLVGQSVGRGDPGGARRAAGAGLVTGVGFMTATAILFLTVPAPLARLFSTDAPVVQMAAALLPIAGVFQVFDGVQVVAAGALRGVGDTRVPMILVLIGFWLIGLPLCFLFGLGLDLGARGVWWGLASGLGVVAVLLTHRIERRFGRALGRLVIDDDPPHP